MFSVVSDVVSYAAVYEGAIKLKKYLHVEIFIKLRAEGRFKIKF